MKNFTPKSAFVNEIWRRMKRTYCLENIFRNSNTVCLNL